MRQLIKYCGKVDYKVIQASRGDGLTDDSALLALVTPPHPWAVTAYRPYG